MCESTGTRTDTVAGSNKPSQTFQQGFQKGMQCNDLENKLKRTSAIHLSLTKDFILQDIVISSSA